MSEVTVREPHPNQFSVSSCPHLPRRTSMVSVTSRTVRAPGFPTLFGRCSSLPQVGDCETGLGVGTSRNQCLSSCSPAMRLGARGAEAVPVIGGRVPFRVLAGRSLGLDSETTSTTFSKQTWTSRQHQRLTARLLSSGAGRGRSASSPAGRVQRWSGLGGTMAQAAEFAAAGWAAAETLAAAKAFGTAEGLRAPPGSSGHRYPFGDRLIHLLRGEPILPTGQQDAAITGAPLTGTPASRV